MKRPKRITLSLIMATIVAATTATNCFATQPKASIDAPPRVASGNVIFLNGSESVSDRPFVWKQVGATDKPLVMLKFDQDGKKAAAVLIPGAPDGVYSFVLVAIGVTPGVKPDDPPMVDVACDVVQVTVGALTPIKPEPPGPNPGPTPLPTPAPILIPTDPTERKGYDYAKAVNDAITSALGAAALGRYDSTSELGAAQRKAFTDGLRAAFDPISSDLIKQVGELSSQPSARDVQAAQDYLKKIQTGVKAAK